MKGMKKREKKCDCNALEHYRYVDKTVKKQASTEDLFLIHNIFLVNKN